MLESIFFVDLSGFLLENQFVGVGQLSPLKNPILVPE
jgi:hypothetical protein